MGEPIAFRYITYKASAASWELAARDYVTRIFFVIQMKCINPKIAHHAASFARILTSFARILTSFARILTSC